MLLGKISALVASAGIRLTIDGEDEPTTKPYHFLSSYKPQTGDRVLIEEIGDSYVVLGKITDNPNSSSLLPQASSVWNRTHSDFSYPIVFYETNQNFYIAHSGGTWRKITTS